MSDNPDNPENKAVETDREVSRRKVLGKAALVVGGAVATVASGVDARIALARPSDVSIDSSGKVTIKGTVLAEQTTKSKIQPRPQAPMRSRSRSPETTLSTPACQASSGPASSSSRSPGEREPYRAKLPCAPRAALRWPNPLNASSRPTAARSNE